MHKRQVHSGSNPANPVNSSRDS